MFSKNQQNMEVQSKMVSSHNSSHEHQHHEHHGEDKKKKTLSNVTIALLIVAIALIAFNQFRLVNLSTLPSQVQGSSGSSGSLIATGTAIVEASSVAPKGTPDIYGKELSVNYDDVSAVNPGLADQTISTLGNLDRTMTLQGNELERYIYITSQISCEYCCGAKSIITRKEDIELLNKKIEEAIASGQITKADAEKYRQSAGQPACGCAHSYAMRGLAKYLIQKHGSEFTDDQVLEEMAKWKTLFFPGAMAAKAEVMKQKGIPFSYTNLGSNKYRDIEKSVSSSGSGGGMVGGC